MKSDGLLYWYTESWRLSSEGLPFYPWNFQESVRDGNVDYFCRDSGYMLLTFMLEGSLLFRCDGAPERRVDPGVLHVVPLGSSYGFRSEGPRRYRKLAVELRGPQLSAVCRSFAMDGGFVWRPDDPADFERRMRELGALVERGDEAETPKAMGLTCELLAILAKGRSKLDASSRLLTGAKARLEANFDRPLSIAALASELGVCHSFLDRAFRKGFGVSPKEYRARRKMEEAKRLLANSSLSIKELAAELGYSSQLYFSSDFRRRCGCSPSGYRRANSTPGESGG